MQETPSTLHPGLRVRARGEAWRVTGVTAYAHVDAVELRGAGAANHGASRTLLRPFDRLLPEGARWRPRLVSRARWMTACRHLLISAAAMEALWTAARASVDLYAYQLEPALALVRGRSARLLIADEVGLGKTIQAGLALNELRARGRGDHVLILTPAGLRDQWARELADRFQIPTDLVDSESLMRASAALPGDVNPWTLPRVFIASIDYVKRPEVVQGMEAVVWDALIVDEAHAVAGDSDRAAAVRLLASRARHVLLLTATPHRGDEADFRALCAVGQAGADDDLLMFRRSRVDIGVDARYTARLVRVSLTPDERRMHDLLDAYCRKVWGDNADSAARLAMTVLKKRALSSAASLGQSVERRLAWLTQDVIQPAEQLSLLDAPDEDEDEDGAPDGVLGATGLSNAAHERAWLGAIAAAARTAARHESKLARLCRLVARTAEPLIVFTEYRDTLMRIAAAVSAIASTTLLHGGLSRRERLLAEDAFNRGAARILLATDAAGQGLNLHARCRWVINFELPWSPTRLEQRIGRVHRIGQQRRVHATHLFAARTAEATVLGRLAARLDQIRASLGRVDDVLGASSDGRIADAVVHDDPRLLPSITTGPHADAALHATQAVRGTFAAEACAELSRLTLVRRLHACRAATLVDPVDALERRMPWVTTLRYRLSGRRSRSLEAAVVVLVRAHIIDAAGQRVETCLVPVVARLDGSLRLRHAADLRGIDALLRQAAERAIPAARAALAARVLALQHERAPAIVRAMARERAIIDDRAVRLAARLVQPGLFDRRPADKGVVPLFDREPRDRRAVEADGAHRLARLEASLVIECGDPEPLLALLV